jgi:hypothetical protein
VNYQAGRSLYRTLEVFGWILRLSLRVELDPESGSLRSLALVRLSA